MITRFASALLRRCLPGLLLLAATATAGANTATEPVPRDAHWLQHHESLAARARQGGVDVLFLGDSITDFWQTRGKAVWEKYFVPLHAADFGINGDRTQHVLWRLDQGELDGIQPKVVVLLIGTNNTGLEKDRPVPRNTTVEAIAGVKAVVAELRSRLPAAKILLLAILPRGLKDDPIRAQIREVNAAIAGLDDGKSIRFLDIGARLTAADGTISTEIMPDLLHPSEQGYAILADAIQGPLAELLR